MGDATDVIGGGTPSTTNPANFEGSIPWITPADMSGYSGKTISGGSRCISEQGLEDSGARWLPQGTVLFSSRAPIGYVAIASQPVTTNQGFKSFVPGSGLNSDYLYYWLTSAKQQAEALASGTTFLELSGAKAALIPFPLAPTAEQTRIVAKLEELLSDLDAGVAELKAARKKLPQYRQSLLKAAVEGALTADWRRQNKPVETGAQLLDRILTERRARWEAKQLARFKEQGKTPPKDWQKKYPEPVQPDITDLPGLPEGWVWASVEQLGEVQLGRQRSPDKVGGASPTPYIRAANVTEGGIDLGDVLEMDFSEAEKRTFALKFGDVLLTEASGSAEHVGRPAIWRYVDGLYCFQNTVLRFSPLGIGSEYGFYSFLAMQKLGVFRKLSGGVGINHLSAGKFSKLPMPLPPLAEQLALINIIEQKFALCDEQLSSINHSLKQSVAQRQNLLRAAFAGQLVPQDPNDEPASELLARIRAERAARDAVKKPRGRKIRGVA
jgi:type I restriction enzyme S subunit